MPPTSRSAEEPASCIKHWDGVAVGGWSSCHLLIGGSLVTNQCQGLGNSNRFIGGSMGSQERHPAQASALELGISVSHLAAGVTEITPVPFFSYLFSSLHLFTSFNHSVFYTVHLSLSLFAYQHDQSRVCRVF